MKMGTNNLFVLIFTFIVLGINQVESGILAVSVHLLNSLDTKSVLPPHAFHCYTIYPHLQ